MADRENNSQERARIAAETAREREQLSDAQAAENARQHRDGIARLRAQLDQDGERVAMLGENVAAFWLGLVKGGIPEMHAVFIAQEYVKVVMQQGADIRAAQEREARRQRGEL